MQAVLLSFHEFDFKIVLDPKTLVVKNPDDMSDVGCYEFEDVSNTLKICFHHNFDLFRNESLDVAIEKSHFINLMKCKESVRATVRSQRFFYIPKRVFIRAANPDHWVVV